MDLHKKFKFFLLEKRLKGKEFAEVLEIHPVYFSQIMIGRLFPGRKLIEKIEKATGKIIRRSDFIRNRNKLNKQKEKQNHHESEDQK